MKKVIRLTESDLAKLVRRIIKENEENTDGYNVSHKWYERGYHILKGKVKDDKLIVHSYETDSKDSEVKDWYQEIFDLIKNKPVRYEKTSGGFYARGLGNITTID